MSYPISRKTGKRMDGPEWRRQSKAYLKEHPNCAICGKPGADTVDHIKAHEGNEALFWDKANWQGVHGRCHNSKTRRVDMTRKTDNGHMGAKLDLRRHFLKKYHGDGDIRVLDCCQGTGKIWSILRKEFPVAGYWGLDMKPKKGRLKLDSARVLSMPGLRENVIDIDTYGSPWKHWLGLCQNLDHPATVFLTIGMVRVMGGHQDNASMGMIGLGPLLDKVPHSIKTKLNDLAVSYCLTSSYEKIRIIEAVEAMTSGNARYVGVRLEPLP